MRKYEITNETHPNNKNLKRIRALKDFSNVKRGELGGFIESEKNLDQEGNCWLSGNAKVFRNAVVSGDAVVSGNAVVSGYAKVYGDAVVSDNAQVYGDEKSKPNDNPEILLSLPEEVTSITISGITYTQKVTWVAEEK
jgi:NDP-sugar pyrophosphorylase family protein